MNRSFAGFGNEYIASDSDKITDIQQFFPNDIIEGFVFTGADIISFEIKLYPAMGILDHGKIGLAHISYTHDPAGQAHIGKLVFVFGIELLPDGIGGWVREEIRNSTLKRQRYWLGGEPAKKKPVTLR